MSIDEAREYSTRVAADQMALSLLSSLDPFVHLHDPANSQSLNFLSESLTISPTHSVRGVYMDADNGMSIEPDTVDLNT